MIDLWPLPVLWAMAISVWDNAFLMAMSLAFVPDAFFPAFDGHKIQTEQGNAE